MDRDTLSWFALVLATFALFVAGFALYDACRGPKGPKRACVETETTTTLQLTLIGDVWYPMPTTSTTCVRYADEDSAGGSDASR